MDDYDILRFGLANDVNDNMVITRNFSNAIDITYSGMDVKKTIEIDVDKGKFILVD